jgi:6-phosphogluconate dehydrogenase
MPGGPRAAYDMVKDVLELIAAKVRGEDAVGGRAGPQRGGGRVGAAI